MALDTPQGTQDINRGLSDEDAATAIAGLLDSQEQPADDEAPASTSDEETEEETEAEDETESEAEDDSEDEEEDSDLNDDDEDDEGEEEPSKEDNLPSPEELRKGYLRQEDYTRKTQEVAEQKRQLEEAQQKAQQETESKIRQLESYLANFGEQEPTQEYWQQLYEQDPSRYVWEKEQHRDRQAQKAEAQRLVQEHHAQKQRQAQEQYQQYLGQQREELAQMVPELVDPDEGPKLRDKIVNYVVTTYDVPREQVLSVADAKIVTALYKAMKYDELQGKKKDVKKKVSKAPPVQKPGTSGKSKNDGKRKRKQRLRQTGHVRDAAALIGDLDLD